MSNSAFYLDDDRDDGLCERLKYLRESQRPIKSMSVTSELCGLPTTSYRRFERGDIKPSYDSIKKICEYFEVSADWLLGIEQ